MHHRKRIIFQVFISGCILLNTAATVKTTAEAYKLVWSDEFDADGKPDSSVWSFEKGFVRNQEYQWYHPDNAFCKDGLLIIEARKEKIKNPDYDPASTNWRKNRNYA